MIKKHYLEKVFATRFQNVGKPYKTIGNAVSQNAKTHCGHPYEPVGNEDFGATISKIALKMIKSII